MTGGELPALVIIDSLTRLLDNAINKDSLTSESFDDNLLDYPVYTKPFEYDGYQVPEVLLSGNHQEINKFLQIQREEITKKYRPDLYKKYNDSKGE